MGKIVTMGELLVRFSTKEANLFEQATDFNVNYGGVRAMGLWASLAIT